MNFDLSDEQRMLQVTVERFAAEHYDPANRMRLLATVGSDRSRWRMMAEQGWLALSLPETLGGLAGTPVDVMALMEVFGRHLILEPFVTNCALAPALLVHGSGATAAAALRAVGSGDAQIALAYAESGGGFDLHRVTTTASRSEEGYRLTGVKCHAEDGADAEWFVISARTRGAPDERNGISLFLVPRDAPGILLERYRSIDHRRHARLRLEDVPVSIAQLVGPLDGGLTVLEEGVDRAIAAHMAEALGCMDALSAMTLTYLKSRRQFDAPIGSFQALQHRMADIAIACEEARSMLYHVTLHLESEPRTRRRAVSAAKARIGQLALHVGRQCVQLHGGIGVTDQLIVSHHLRRLMMIDLAYGSCDYHRTIFANTD